MSQDEVSNDTGEVDNLRRQLAAQDAEIERLQVDCNRLRICNTCDGVGGLRMKTGEDSQGNEQFGEMEQCPACLGTGINEWATTLDRAAAMDQLVEACESALERLGDGTTRTDEVISQIRAALAAAEEAGQ